MKMKTSQKQRVSRLFVLWTVVFVVLAAMSMTASAQVSTEATDGLSFTLNEDASSYSVTGYFGTRSEVIVPAKYNGLPVTSIKAGIFLDKSDFSGSNASNDAIVMPDDLLISPVEKIIFLSKSIQITDDATALPMGAIICAHPNTAAYKYAQKYGRTLVSLPTILSANVELGADITVNYTVEMTDQTIQDVVMRFTVNGNTTRVTGVAGKTAGQYVFSFKGIGPHMIGDNICAELLMGDTVVDTVEAYSVRQYCLNMLSRVQELSIPNYDERKHTMLGTLIADLLSYGANAQLYTNYHTDALVDQGIAGMSTYTSPNNNYANVLVTPSTAADQTSLISAAVELSNTIRLRFSFATADVSAVTIQIGSMTFDSSDFIDTNKTNEDGLPIYVVYSNDIYATQIEQDFDVSLYVDGTKCQSLTYSVLNYVYRKQNDSNATLAALVKSIHCYGLSAHHFNEYKPARLVTTKYTTNDVIIADIVATDAPYLADPTGKTDSTHIIQRAIDDCAKRGGGTVYLPAGEYLITSTLYVTEGVVLRGDWQDPDTVASPEYGTVILADPKPLEDYERDDLNAKPLVHLLSNSGVMGLTFYYPNQNATTPVPYGYTVYSQDNNTVTIRDITMINSYRGVGASLVKDDWHCIMQLDRLRICALESGVEMDGSRDVGYAVNINVSPSYWSEAGGKYKCTDSAALATYCRENAVGITIKSLDDEHFSNLSIDGCRTAIHIATPENGSGFWGLVYDVTIQDCTYGIVANRVNTYGGYSITKAIIDADEYAIISTTSEGVIKLCGIELTGKGGIVATNNARIVWDQETDVSSYAIDYGTYQKPASYVYFAPVLKLSGTKQDISTALQQTLDKAAATGGVVYIPAGFYTLLQPVTVPAGVQLRGAMDMYTYAWEQNQLGGTFIISYVQNGATITLKDHAGVNGISVFNPVYTPDEALALTRAGNGVIETAATIKGDGRGVYVINSTFIGNFIGIDFTGCDDHLIREAFGCTFNTFARVGGTGGVVERVMNTFHMVGRNPLSTMGYFDETRCDVAAWNAIHKYDPERISTLRDDLLRTHYNVIEVVGAQNEQVSNVFMFTPGCMVYTDNSTATLLNISSDAHGLKPMFDITNGSNVVAVGALRSGGKSLGVDSASTFKLYNRVAICDWYEPNFDSTLGDNPERTYTEYGSRLTINDGSNTTGVTGVTLYSGSEFAKSGNTSLYYTSSSTVATDTVLVQSLSSLDISSYMNEDGYLHMWVYVDDLTNLWWTGYIRLESANGSICWSTSTSLRSHGWNELYLPLKGAVIQGSFDASNVRTLRFTNYVGSTVDHPDIYVDDIYLTLADIDQHVELVAQSTVPSFSAISPSRKDVPADPIIDRTIVDGKLMMFDCESPYKKLLLNSNPAYVKEGESSWQIRGAYQSNMTLTFDPVDISSFMKTGYLHMWIYVAEDIDIDYGQIELSSSGTCDVQEIRWAPKDYISAKAGWNELFLPLKDAIPYTNSGFDPTNTNFMRLYLYVKQGTVPTIYVDDIYFYNGLAEQSFTVGEQSEQAYLVPGKEAGYNTSNHVRYADKAAAFVYQYSLTDAHRLGALTWSATTGQQLHLQVSVDNQYWVDVYRYVGVEDDQGLAMQEREYDLLPLIRSLLTDSSTTLYIKVTDAYSSTGWGGAVSAATPTVLKAYYGFVEHSFTVGDEHEQAYLVPGKEASYHKTNHNRYADKTSEFIYQYNLTDADHLRSLRWNAAIGQQLHLQISLDGRRWIDVFKYVGSEDDRGLTVQARGYELLPLIQSQLTQSNATLYVKISDAYTSTGYGGSISATVPVTLQAFYK